MILEDDSEDIYHKIINIIIDDNSTSDIILLDKRARGGACAVLYNQKISNMLIDDLHPI